MKDSKLHVAHKANGPIETKENKIDDALYQILETLPKPDVKFKLSSAQKKWWYYFGYEFISTKQVSKLDLVHLQKAAFWMDARCQAYKEIQDIGYKGLVQKFASGATNVTGHVTIIEKADKHLEEVSSHFGLSIKDRQKLKTETTSDQQLSLFDEILGKLAQ